LLIFKTIELADRQVIEKYLKQEDAHLLDYTFQILFLYQPIYDYQYAIGQDFLFLKTCYKGCHSMFFPMGDGDLKEAFRLLEEYAQSQSFEIQYYPLTPEHIKSMQQLFPEQFDFFPVRERFEYIYLKERLATLKGRTLQAKRNNINHLTKNFEWSYEVMDDAHIEDCKKLEQAWNTAQGTIQNSDLELENRIVMRCFEYYKTLDIAGGVIRLNGKISAFSLGCRLNSNTYLILFEKAHPNIRGLYSAISQQFVLHNATSYTYINKEEDCGIPGLQIAKMQYHPDILQEIYCGYSSSRREPSCLSSSLRLLYK
jgi:hypothetical protein